jgi:hypothetical protein
MGRCCSPFVLGQNRSASERRDDPGSTPLSAATFLVKATAAQLPRVNLGDALSMRCS